MERMLPKMYKDLLGIVSVLWIVWYPHQVVAEESLCHLDVRPQPYSLKEEVGNLVWEYPKVSLQWNTDQSRKNAWKKDLKQRPEWKKRLLVWNPQLVQWCLNSSWNNSQWKMHRLRPEGTRKYWSSLKWIEEQPLQLQLSAQETALHPRQVQRARQSESKKRKLRERKKSETRKQRSPQERLRKLKLRSLKKLLRRRQCEGSWTSRWRMQAVSNQYFYSNGSIKPCSETHRTDRTSTSLSIGLSRISGIYPVQTPYSIRPRGRGRRKG